MRLLPLRAGDAVDAVKKPAEHLMMTDALAGQVVRIVAGEDLRRGRDTAGADVDNRGDDFSALEVEPALLSLFCRELNEERIERHQDHFDEQLVKDAKTRRPAELLLVVLAWSAGARRRSSSKNS